MTQFLSIAAIVLAGTAIVGGLVFLLVRATLDLQQTADKEDAGGSAASSVMGALLELDRATRPSIEHIEQVEEQVERDEAIGGE